MSSARRCAFAVEMIKIPSPEAMRGEFRGGSFPLGERAVEIRQAPRGSTSTRGLQPLRGVDIEEGAVAFDRYLSHRLGRFGDQMARADIAIERHQFTEEAARPQDRIAATPLGNGHGDELTAVG